MGRSATSLVSSLACAGALLAFGGGMPEAHANGRFPASNAIVFGPESAPAVVVRVTFGLLVSRDDASSWSWVCERAIGFSGLEDPSYVVTRSGAIVAGLFDGLRVSRDGGCTWERIAADGRVFVDLTLRSDGAVVALASGYDRHGDAGSLYRTQLFVSTDDARTFAPLGARMDEALLAESVEVAPSDPRRIYVSAVRGADTTRRGVVLVSQDGGAHWTERGFDLTGKELAPFIAAVDPRRPDRVFFRTSASPESGTRLVVTDDAARTVRAVTTAKGPLLGFALGADGATLAAGGPDDGLLEGPSSGPLARVLDVKVQCLARQGDVLWACSNEASGFVAGSRRGSAPFAARLHLKDIKGPMECPAGSAVATECAADFGKLRESLGLDAPAMAGPARGAEAGDGGAARAGAAARVAAQEVHHEDSLARSRLAWLLAAAALAAGVLFARSRTRRR
ncbi:MAG: BNR/Asp-box repeat domain protein [Labilithrix sp.]|nr:BNR/Asp-box repeat domain protein [Labilithrix sp.]